MRSLDQVHWLQESKKTNYQFWAVLGSRDCREKNQTAISMQLLMSVFYVFMVKKTFLNFLKLHCIKVRNKFLESILFWVKIGYRLSLKWICNTGLIGPESMISGTRSQDIIAALVQNGHVFNLTLRG